VSVDENEWLVMHMHVHLADISALKCDWGLASVCVQQGLLSIASLAVVQWWQSVSELDWYTLSCVAYSVGALKFIVAEFAIVLCLRGP
jgi:hypothetical protein